MEFSNNNDVLIILNIKDRRGRNIRVSAVKDIKIKVWTHNPDCALTFDYRDIIQKRDCDTLLIKGSQMEALPSGVVTYQYSYKVYDNMPHQNHFHNAEHSEIIVTDIFWKNRYRETVIESPTYYHSLEFMKDMIDRERDERIHQFKDLQYYVIQEYTNKLNDEVERATYREDELEAYINEVSGKTDSNYIELKEKIEAEVKRSTEVDIHFLEIINELDKKYEGKGSETEDKLDSENKRAEEAESQLQSNIEAETERAKIEEKRIEEKLDSEIARSKAEDVQTNLLIETEVTRAKGEESRIESKFDNAVENAKDQIKKIKKEVSKISDSTDGLSAKLDAEISDRKINDNETIANLNAEIKRATTNEDRLEEMIKSNTNLIQNENSRSELVEKDLAESLQKLKQSVLDNNSNVDSTLEDLRNELAKEALERANEDENLQKQIDLLNGDSSVIGSVDHKIADSFHSVEHLLDQFKDSLEAVISGDYATKEELRQEILKLLGEAPEAYNTLGKIAEKLNSDDEVFAVIKEILTGKADAANVYNKAEIDRKEADLNNSIQNETQRATLVENGLQAQIDSLGGSTNTISDKLDNHITTSDERYNELNNSIIAEQTRATNEETKLQNQLDVINGDENTIGSIVHAVADANHYTDDEIEKVMHNVNDIESNINNHIQEAETKFNEIQNQLDNKQEKGDYVEYTTDEDNRKHIILPNHCNIVGRTQDGTDGRNLIMLSKWNVVDIGSTNTPINLNGLGERPTYNDAKELALIEDYQRITDEEILMCANQ